MIQKILAFVTTCAALTGVMMLIVVFGHVRHHIGLPAYTDGLVVAFLNALLPYLFRLWASVVEVHRTESSRQMSLFRKLYVARVLNGIQVVLMHKETEDPTWPQALHRRTLRRLLNLVLSELAVAPLLRLFTAEVYFRCDLVQFLDEAQHPAQRLADKIDELGEESPLKSTWTTQKHSNP